MNIGDRQPLVAAAVVAQDALDLDAPACVPVSRSLQKRDGAVRLLIAQHLGVGEPGVVVDRDVHVLPANAAEFVRQLAADPVTGAADASQFLRVDVQH
ncbi:MAG TPA: hypothetical protein VK256_01735 [Candidatus Eisenbacteria bacterium]|nr:hypothetical protein [Candidatus Eisenbacteria bacterium]